MWPALALGALVVASAAGLPRARPPGEPGTLRPRHVLVDPLRPPPPQPSTRIVNGNLALPGQFPFQAAVEMDGRNFCGGSLIAEQWILTAAHCAYGFDTFTVLLGAIQQTAQDETRLVIQTRTKLVHERYNGLLIQNDVALLNINSPVTYTEFIKPIALTTGSSSYAGNTVRVSGWGRINDFSSVQDQLNYVDLTVITNAMCRDVYMAELIVDSTLCAQGGQGESTCNGDSGGPLVDVKSGLLVGVVSFGPSIGCVYGYPVGFARVSYFLPWIETNSGIDFSSLAQNE